MSLILISGISGFLGSAIAKTLIDNNHQIIGLKRSSTILSRCQKIENSVIWVDVDTLDWEKSLLTLNPEIIVHAAWNGVNSNDRDDLQTQMSNLTLLVKLLEIAEKIHLSKIICLGSQAEYGIINSIISEDSSLRPNNYYGIAKVLASSLVQSVCDKNQIKWYWLRVFSVFGENENDNWFIPLVAKSILEKQELALTSCDQVYSYLHTSEFADMVYEFIKNSPNSGIFNICSNESFQLKTVVELIIEYLSPEYSKIYYGKLKNRENQSTVVQGSIQKYIDTFQYSPSFNFREHLYQTLDIYKSNY